MSTTIHLPGVFQSSDLVLSYYIYDLDLLLSIGLITINCYYVT